MAIGTFNRMRKDLTIVNMPRSIYVTLYIMLVPGIVLDFIFNITYGAVHYRRVPKEWLFSTTTSQIIKEGEQLNRWEQPTKEYVKALKWKETLNAVDPGHIK
jgi:hypothetical protein